MPAVSAGGLSVGWPGAPDHHPPVPVPVPVPMFTRPT
jgi:hypothetical protein